MPLRPRKISRTPTALDLEDPRADVLTDVLGVSLLRNAFYKPIEARAPWGIRAPEKPRAMFYLIARGSAQLEVDGEPLVELSVGDAVFIPRGSAHILRDAKTTTPQFVCDSVKPPLRETRRIGNIGGDGPVTTIIAGFFELGAAQPPLLDRMPNVLHLSSLASGSEPWVAATVQILLAESMSPGPASAIILQRLADVLFVQALRSLTHGTSQCKSHGLGALADPAVHRALGLMHARVEAPWTVGELASAVALSRSGFAARFTELVGEPPLQYLARWRIARAAELLRTGDDAIGVIAERVGYQSVPSFSKAFKRWQGVSPGAFRSAPG